MASHLPHSGETAVGEPSNPSGGVNSDVQAKDIGVVYGGGGKLDC